ncbi:MAG: hypothetical protein KBD50_02335 [Candidatus Pacebacteria bacterium]|nr:hypothetical protein [Candidatus Paceibacterota bacterium]
MNIRVIIFAVVALAIVGAGAFVWITWPKDEAPVVETPVVNEPEPTTTTIASSTMGYTMTYPLDFNAVQDHVYPFSSKKNILGFKVVVPADMATGTNLSADSYVSVEQLPNARLCTADIFMQANVKAATVTEAGVTYSVASSSDAGAGNRYDEMVYALKDSMPCTAVRYFIHYTNIQNYPDGAVTEFNRTALLNEFDQIRHSLQKTN